MSPGAGSGELAGGRLARCLLQIGRRYLGDPRLVVAVVADRTLHLLETGVQAGNRFGGQGWPSRDSGGHVFALLMSPLALDLGQRQAIFAQAKIAFGNLDTDFGAAVQGVLDVSFAGQDVSRGEYRRFAVEQQT